MTRIWPLAHEGLGNSSYLAEVADGQALAVDPGRDPRPYLSLAAAHGLRVAFTADTHVHADYVSGSRELAGLGAQLLAPAGSGLSFGHQELRGGQDLDLGGLTLQALATPGHTPEHLSYLLLDGAQPVAVFTGGALIVGGVARTDLAAPARAQEWTRAAYHSARALLGLPGDLAAYPTHGPGSFCSAGETGEHVTTIGREKAGNPLLARTDEDSFTRQVLARLGSYPAYFARMPAVNRRGAPRHGTSRPVLAALTAAHVAELAAAGATIVDARPIEAFAAAHVPGSLSNALRPAFATWLGWLADPRRPLVVVMDAGQDRGDAVAHTDQVYLDMCGEFVGQEIGEPLVKVVTTQVIVAGCRQHIHDARVQFDERDIERPTPEVIDQHAQVFISTDAVAIRQGRGGWFIENALDRQPGNGPGLDGRLALDLVEIRRHGDDGTVHRLSHGVFRSVLDLAQDEGRNLLRCVGRPGHGDGLTAAHLALDRADGAIRRQDPLVAGRQADQHLAGGGHADHRRQQTFTGNRPYLHGTVLDDTEHRIGGAQIDTDNLVGLTHDGPPVAQSGAAAGRPPRAPTATPTRACCPRRRLPASAWRSR